MERGTEPSGKVDPFDFQPSCNFLAGGLTIRVIDRNRAHLGPPASWHGSIYALARGIADEGEIYQVIEVGGVGTGDLLCDYFDSCPIEPLFVPWHWGGQLDPASDTNEQAATITCDPENAGDLESLAAAIDGSKPTLIILANVIEYLFDPRYLLRTVRRILKRNAGSRLIISTCDSKGTASPPRDRGYVRQWTLDEFQRALMASGFVVRKINYLDTDSGDSCARAIVAEIACSNDNYSKFLLQYELPPAADHVVFTTEHALAGPTGVIGTYLAQAVRTGPRLIVVAGAQGLPEDWLRVTKANGWLNVADLCRQSDRKLSEPQEVGSDEILQALQQVLFLYDDVRLVEYQDYDGIGLRIAQGKRAGLLPPSVSVLAYAHGNRFLQEAGDGLLGLDCAPTIHARERLSLELADYVAFPSSYIRNLYVEHAGYRLRSEMPLPYPYHLRQRQIEQAPSGTKRTLIFYGEQTRQKGYYDFVDAVLKLFNGPEYVSSAGSITRIVLIGISDPDPRLKQVPAEILYGEWNTAQVGDMLRRYASEALVALPCRGGGLLSFYEVADSDCQFVAYAAEGDSLLIPETLREVVLCAPNSGALAEALNRSLKLSHSDRLRIGNQVRAFLSAQAIQNTEVYRAKIDELKESPVFCPKGEIRGALTVIVPNLNGRREYLTDAIFGIQNSSHHPSMVIFVDDGSTPENQVDLQDAASLLGTIPREIVFNGRNIGLSAARNVGLAKTTTPYVCVHDNDNIVLSRFFELACRMLDENPEVAAVTAWAHLFDDGAQWQTEEQRVVYRPLGADLGVGLRQNIFGDALAVYRVEKLRQLGGWDDASNAMWGNWQLFARFVAMGEDVWIIPSEQFLYRVRGDSMQRTFAQFPGWLRLTTILPVVPKAHAVAILRALWSPLESPAWALELQKVHQAWAAQVEKLRENWARQMQSTNEAWAAAVQKLNEEGAGKLQSTNEAWAANVQELSEQLQIIENSETWRVASKLESLMARHPRITAYVRAFLALMRLRSW